MSSQASPNPNADDNADAGRAPDRDADRLIEQRPGGAVVGGRYELLEPIGEGAWRASTGRATACSTASSR